MNLTLFTLNGTEFVVNETRIITVGTKKVIQGAGLPLHDPDDIHGQRYPRPPPDRDEKDDEDPEAAPYDPDELFVEHGPLIINYDIDFPSFDDGREATEGQEGGSDTEDLDAEGGAAGEDEDEEETSIEI